jgi:hypothetical protein
MALANRVRNVARRTSQFAVARARRQQPATRRSAHFKTHGITTWSCLLFADFVVFWILIAFYNHAIRTL